MLVKKIVTTAFIFGGIAAGTLLSTPATHATSASTNCVDGTNRSNLSESISSDHKTVTVTTKNNQPLCSDLTLYWSSYTMPKDYNGGAFTNNTTASPQVLFDNAVITMPYGSTKATATVKLPTCDNYQTDVYYGPEITNVTAAGHGNQWLNGQINGFDTSYTGSRSIDLTSCQPTTTTTTSTPTTPSTTETSTPVITELPSTGIRENLTVIVAAALAAGAYATTRFVMKKRAL